MRMNKQQEWKVAADPNDLVGFMHEMEAFLQAKASSINGLSLKDYFVSGGSGENHHRVSAEDLLDVVASLSKPLYILQATLDNSRRDRRAEPNLYNFNIWTAATRDEGRSVSLKVTCFGPTQEDAQTLFTAVLAQFTREVGRRNRDTPLPMQPAPTTKSKSVEGATTSSQPSPEEPTFVKTLITHPLPVTVIGSLVAGGIIWLISLGIQKADVPTTPTTTTVTTAVTVYSPSPSPSPPPSPPSKSVASTTLAPQP